jgi:hypothetical protein
LEQSDGAEKWALELARERSMLQRAESEPLDKETADEKTADEENPIPSDE